MQWPRWVEKLRRLLRHGHSRYEGTRGQVTHVIILDGTMSTLDAGHESNAGLAYRLLGEVRGARLSLYYEAGVQWQDWRATGDVVLGRGINGQIRRAYGYLASRYRAGDRIVLLGYSRGAYAVRSLAGIIDQVGLLTAREATERNILIAYRHYQAAGESAAERAFVAGYCHDRVEIEMIGVWDTVKALGLRLPVLWRWSEPAHAFHNHRLGPSIRRGYHALALDETRSVYTPVLWETPEGFEGKVEQVWFRGNHGDVGGQLGGVEAARPLANVSFRWMMGKLEECGVALPEGWEARFPADPEAPSCGSWNGWGKIFLMRRAREVGRDPSERLHESVRGRDDLMPGMAAAQ